MAEDVSLAHCVETATHLAGGVIVVNGELADLAGCPAAVIAAAPLGLVDRPILFSSDAVSLDQPLLPGGITPLLNHLAMVRAAPWPRVGRWAFRRYAFSHAVFAFTPLRHSHSKEMDECGDTRPQRSERTGGEEQQPGRACNP